MKPILILTAVFIMASGAYKSFARTDADNFYESNHVKTRKVSFPNLYKMNIGARLFTPEDMKDGVRYPAIIVGHPMGAVKEQSANLDAYQRSAEPKELYTLPGAGHVDLYDRTSLIPFDKLETFFNLNMK